jgi:outer membrane protein assembly factor BamB
VHWKITRGVNDVSSPVLYEGLLYWVKENGIIYCVDAATGEVVWRDRLQGGVKYHGSLVAGDGKVYIPSLDGDITVIEAGREFKLLARNSIGENSGASPAISAGRIFIRGENHLFCIGSPAAP